MISRVTVMKEYISLTMSAMETGKSDCFKKKSDREEENYFIKNLNCVDTNYYSLESLGLLDNYKARQNIVTKYFTDEVCPFWLSPFGRLEMLMMCVCMYGVFFQI